MFDLFNGSNLAYLDPGTGSLIIQSLIGVVAGVSVFGRNAIGSLSSKAKRLFSRGDSNEKSDSTSVDVKATEAKEAK